MNTRQPCSSKSWVIFPLPAWFGPSSSFNPKYQNSTRITANLNQPVMGHFQKFIYWSPNPLCLRIWLYLVIGLLKKKLKRGCLRESHSSLTGVVVRRGDRDTDLHRERPKWRDREEMAVCQLRRETSKKPTLMTPWSGPFKLPAVWENTFLLFWCSQSKVLCLGSLSILRYSLNLLFGAAGGVSCLVCGVLAPGGYSSLAFLLLRVLIGLYLTSPIQSPSSEARE